MAETTTINTKAEAIRRFFADSKAENHPIKEHPISAMEEYVRDLYLDMLCVVAQYECRDTENGFTLIRRIMAACAGTQPLAEYIKHSMEITPEKTAEFIRQCKDSGLCEIFMIDSMLMSCANGTPNAKQVGFIAQFGDMLGFDKSKMEEMSKFALAIMKQDSKMYKKLLNDKNGAIQTKALCYSKDFVTGLIVCTSKERYYFSKELSEYTCQNLLEDEYDSIFQNFKYYLGFKEDMTEKMLCERMGCETIDAFRQSITKDFSICNLNEIRFENIILNFDDMYLSTIKNVVFEGCHILSCPLHLTSIDKVLINNCTFKWEGKNRYRSESDTYDNYYYNRAIEADLSASEVIITNTTFSGFCVYSRNDCYSDGKGTGAVFCDTKRDGETVKVLFDKCDFSDIYVSCGYYRDYGTYTIFYGNSNYNVTLTNCHFSNCNNDRTDSYSCLFYADKITEHNNKLVNSKPIFRR